MNQRREPRLEALQSIWVTVFGEPDIRLPAQVKNISNRGVGLSLLGPVAIGSALKIELEDSLLLGEVIYCRDDESSFYVGVELEQALVGLQALAQSVSVFASPGLSSEEAHAVKERRYENE